MSDAASTPSSASSGPAPPSGRDHDEDLTSPDIESGGDRLGEGIEDKRGDGNDGPSDEEEENEAYSATRDVACDAAAAAARTRSVDKADENIGTGEEEGDGESARMRTAAPPIIGILEKEERIVATAEESVGGRMMEDDAVLGEPLAVVTEKDRSGDDAADSSAARKAPSPPSDNDEDESEESLLAQDEKFRKTHVSPRSKVKCATRRSRRIETMESEEEEKREVGESVGPSEPTKSPLMPKVAMVPHWSDRGGPAHTSSPSFKTGTPEKVGITVLDGGLSTRSDVGSIGLIAEAAAGSGFARPEKVSATAPGDRIFAGSFTGSGGGMASSGDVNGEGTTGVTAGAGPAPRALEVPGVDEEEVSPSDGSSSHDETAPPILEGTLVTPHHQRARERVYDGVPVPSEKEDDGRFRGPLKRILAATVIICGVAAVVAPTVTLSGQRSTSDSGSLMESPLPTMPALSFPIPTYGPATSLTEKEVLILKHLEEVFGDIVNEERTPYADATEWILSEDGTGPANRTSEFFAQRYILALLYYSTNGAYWKAKRFLTPGHHCGWYGIICDNDEFVQSIRMWDNGMVGKLPSELTLMQSLQILDFTRNYIEGTIASEIGRLTQLRELHLTSDVMVYYDKLQKEEVRTPQGRLSGSLPSSIGNLSQLEVLALSGNGDLGGTLPEEFYHLESLVAFYADSTNFSGLFSKLIDGINDHLIHLEVLFIRYNRFTGSIPSSVGNMTSLEILDVSYNYLTGPLPDELFTLESLTRFYCRGIDLTGTVSALIGRLTNLEELDISWNDFTGSIPTSVGDLVTLEYLYLSENDFTGALPSTIGALASLVEFRTEENKLSGALPEELYGMESLRVLHLGFNALNGSISPLIGRLDNLEAFRIGGNSFSGTLPATIGNLSSLTYLSAWGNDLTGPLPDEFYELESLTILLLNDNALTGTISSRVGQLRYFEYFWIRNNFFSGTIPAELAEIVTIRSIDVYWNNFTGNVSEAFCELDWLVWFSVDCGPTNGTGPPSVECQCCTYCCDTARKGDRGGCQWM